MSPQLTLQGMYLSPTSRNKPFQRGHVAENLLPYPGRLRWKMKETVCHTLESGNLRVHLASLLPE